MQSQDSALSSRSGPQEKHPKEPSLFTTQGAKPGRVDLLSRRPGGSTGARPGVDPVTKDIVIWGLLSLCLKFTA